jgi:aconitate hydratase
LRAHGVAREDFNSYGARRGNHDVMVRGTFANVRLRNQLAPGTEGGFTTYLPTGEVMSIYEASTRYQADGVPLIILAGREYGTGSSRDWAAKGPALLGVRAVIAQSYERIHRSNLIGMGILPLQFAAEESVESHGLTGHETFEIVGLADAVAKEFAAGKHLKVRAYRDDGAVVEFTVQMRLDTPQEVLYYRHGGILQYVLRRLLKDQDRRAISPQPRSGEIAAASATPDYVSGRT